LIFLPVDDVSVGTFVLVLRSHLDQSVTRLHGGGDLCGEGIPLEHGLVVVDVAQRQLHGHLLGSGVVAAAVGGHHLERVHPLLFPVQQAEITCGKTEPSIPRSIYVARRIWLIAQITRVSRGAFLCTKKSACFCYCGNRTRDNGTLNKSAHGSEFSLAANRKWLRRAVTLFLC
jgi:hypothetical protein